MSVTPFFCRDAERTIEVEAETPILRSGHSAHIKPSQILAIHDLTFGEVSSTFILLMRISYSLMCSVVIWRRAKMLNNRSVMLLLVCHF